MDKGKLLRLPNALPRRASLVTEVVKVLRREIEEGVWRDFLPGEHALSARLQVSRPTLRTALNVLRREGWIEVSQGRRRRIAARGKRSRPRTESKVVAIVVSLPYHKVSPFGLFLISELQTHLHDAGYRLEIVTNPRFVSSRLDKSLRNQLSLVQARCWVVLGQPGGACAWLAEQHERALVVGSRVPGLTLPVLGVDNCAMVRHAVGECLRHGHRALTLLSPRVEANRDDSMERGFWEGASLARPSLDPPPTVEFHDGSVEGVCAALTRLFERRKRPTVILVIRPKHVSTTMTHLMNTGLRIPRDVSLLALGHDHTIDDLVPSVAHYEIDWEAFARRLCRMALELAESGSLSNDNVLPWPGFVRATPSQRAARRVRNRLSLRFAHLSGENDKIFPLWLQLEDL